MNVLMVGVLFGKGSFEMRGQQLGGAMGARVTMHPTAADWRWADLVVLIKRAWVTWATQAQAAKLPIVWDALDCWRQPAENQAMEAQAQALLYRQIAQIQPVLTLGATEAQAKACDGVCLPHHSWPWLQPSPARDRVSCVAYEGNPAYLGVWQKRLEQACASRGWTFVINPPDLRQADILVAFRDGIWDGWICREWKSGVKLVNAIAAGRPILTQDSAAWREIQPDGSLVESVSDLDDALDRWSQAPDASIARSAVVERCRERAPEYSLVAMVTRYQNILQGVRVGVPC